MKFLFRKTRFAMAMVLAVVLLFSGIDLGAQAALIQTTLGADLANPTSPQGNPSTVITLASGTGVAVGQGIFVDAEYMTIQSSTPQATRWNVVRGQGGTVARAHASGSPVFIGAPNYFGNSEPVGPCTSTLTTATPFISVGSGSIFLCPAVSTLTGSTAATWARITQAGYPYLQSTRYTGWTYATAGALTLQPGVQFIGSGGALAMTLASPSKYMDGMVMVIQASTAQAHTVTYTPGFYGTTTSSDVATFGGAIGDNLVIYATNGVWRILSLKGITVA